MNDLQKIVVLCVVGLVLVGIFFYSLSNTDRNEEIQVEQPAQEESTDISERSTSSDEADNAATSSPETEERPDRNEELPTSTDAGMEFPILE